jgi:Uma2 family endonuclease
MKRSAILGNASRPIHASRRAAPNSSNNLNLPMRSLQEPAANPESTTTTFVTVEEYLRTSYDPDAEYVDGQIEERAAAESDHFAWQAAICFWFELQAKQGQIRVRPSLRIQVAPTCFLVPDVSLLDRNRPIEKIATHPPVAVFEILSPTDTFKRVTVKCGQYHRMGIQTILVIDPDSPTYQYVSGSLEKLKNRAFHLPGSTARFDLDEIEKLLD